MKELSRRALMGKSWGYGKKVGALYVASQFGETNSSKQILTPDEIRKQTMKNVRATEFDLSKVRADELPAYSDYYDCFNYEFVNQGFEGYCTYYIWDGCVGCRSDRIMANGEQLNDLIPTMACNILPLNQMVLVVNADNGYAAFSRVTDRGGFTHLADLNWATHQAIGNVSMRSLVQLFPVNCYSQEPLLKQK